MRTAMMVAPDRSFLSSGIRLRYRDDGEGPAVVLLHGWTLDLEVWDPQAAALARELRVIRIDRRGFGRSGGDPDASADAGDLESLLDGLRLAQAALVGMSQGARAAIGFALGHPGRVTALVLDGAPGDIAGLEPDEEELSFAEFRRLAQDRGMDGFRAAWRRHPLMRLHAAGREQELQLERVLERYPGRDLLGAARSPPAHPDAGALARLAVPALVLNGALDTRRRLLAGERLCALLPHAERALVPGAGHLANLDNPRAYNDIILSFLRRQSRAAA